MNQLSQQRKWNRRLHCVEIIIVLLLNDEVDETRLHIVSCVHMSNPKFLVLIILECSLGIL